MTAPPDDNDNQGNNDDDQGLRQIHVPGSVLSGVCNEQDNVFVKVKNLTDATELVGVYMDVIPPGGPSNPGGCQPSGRILQTTVVIPVGGQVNVLADTTGTGLVTFACSNQNAVAGQSYTFIAVVDDHADDPAACGPGALLSLTCFNALCSDVSNCSDFRLSTTGATVRK